MCVCVCRYSVTAVGITDRGKVEMGPASRIDIRNHLVFAPDVEMLNEKVHRGQCGIK